MVRAEKGEGAFLASSRRLRSSLTPSLTLNLHPRRHHNLLRLSRCGWPACAH